MANIPNTNQNAGLFLPSTFVWDASRLYDINVNSEEFKEIIVRLHESTNSIAISMNLKDSGYYPLTEFVSGQLLFSNTAGQAELFRQAYRLVVNIGALPPGIKSVFHNLAIMTGWSFMHIYGTANTNVSNDYYPMPWAGAAGAYISLNVNATQVVIDNQSGVSFLDSYVVLEYVKSN